MPIPSYLSSYHHYHNYCRELIDECKKLRFKFTCRNWISAINFITQASVVAESDIVQHHPDLHLTKYRDIEVILHTHSANGLTLYDFKLARELDKIKIDYSPKFLRSNPQVDSSASE